MLIIGPKRKIQYFKVLLCSGEYGPFGINKKLKIPLQ